MTAAGVSRTPPWAVCKPTEIPNRVAVAACEIRAKEPSHPEAEML